MVTGRVNFVTDPGYLMLFMLCGYLLIYLRDFVPGKVRRRTMEDAQVRLHQLQAVRFDDCLNPHPSVRCRFRDAGHTLGLAIIEVLITENGKTTRIVLSGGLVQRERPILRDPTVIEGDLHAERRNTIMADLAFRFRHFAPRKLHFLMRAKALVALPGGYGTQDEVFEVLTLVQSGKMSMLPIVLFGPEFWGRAVSFDFLVAEGIIAAQDRKLFTLVKTAEQAIAALLDFYRGHPPDALQDHPQGVA